MSNKPRTEADYVKALRERRAEDNVSNKIVEAEIRKAHPEMSDAAVARLMAQVEKVGLQIALKRALNFITGLPLSTHGLKTEREGRELSYIIRTALDESEKKI